MDKEHAALVERLRNPDSAIRPTVTDGRSAADAIEALSRQLDAAQREGERWKVNNQDTWSAMRAMRNSINEHVAIPSLESDLLQGPENSIFCATVARAVIDTLSRARAEGFAEAREAAVQDVGNLRGRDVPKRDAEDVGEAYDLAIDEAQAAIRALQPKEKTQ